MSDVIKLLPDSVANQIAAGEVIQRPASVIKELVENAVDAQASDIQIVLKDAGRTLIQVIDDGLGMSDTDARLAFERHSTSKIRKADDLFSLSTMGFRGEALASIAAIAHVELRTCRRGAQLGTKLLINASVCESQEPLVCKQGANFMIKDLFYNVPARRKFLKSNQVEMANIVKEFEKLALINPNISFTLTHNGNVMYKLMAGTFLQRINSLYGSHVSKQLIPLAVETSLVRIDGFVGKPEAAKKRNTLQFLFVNGRYMRHPYFHKAVMMSYEQLIPDETQPNYFLCFSVDPETIDVNIHPTKTEIKFENEVPIFQILAAAVREALGKFSAVPSIDFDREDAPDIPAIDTHHNAKNVDVPPIAVDTHYNPFRSGEQRKPTVNNDALNNWETLYKNFSGDIPSVDNATPPLNDDLFATTENEPRQQAFQFDTDTPCFNYEGYVVIPTTRGLMFVDQHRAHLKVLYEMHMSHIDGKNITSQSVLFPEVLHLEATQSMVLAELENDMEKIGFNLSNLGNGDWAINATPAGMDGVDIQDTIVKVVDSVINGGADVADHVFQHIALTVARSAAINRTKLLNNEEMQVLVRQLMQLPDPNYTPDGKRIYAVLPTSQIERLF